jgi:hypothetical protein
LRGGKSFLNPHGAEPAEAGELIVVEVGAVRGLLQVMLDPVLRALDEAREWLKHNRPIPHEQVLAELGITQEEIENFKEPA